MLGVREVSEKYGLSFENALAGIAREELISIVSKSEEILISAPDNIGEEAYKKGIDNKIRLAFKKTNGENIKDFASRFVNEVSGDYPDRRLEIYGEISVDGGLRFDVFVENMRVPIRVSLFPVDFGSYTPARREGKLLRSEEEFTYLHFPIEAEIANDVFRMIENLELVGDMGIYDRVYSNIVSLPLEGKLVWSRLNDLLNQKDRMSYLDRMKIVISYKNNSYMTKKWDKYNKRQNNLSEPYKKIVTALEIFISPIWEALMEDRPFIGDWMPKLGRFL